MWYIWLSIFGCFLGLELCEARSYLDLGFLLRPLETNVMPKSSGDPKGVIGGT